MSDEITIFDQILAGEIPANKVYENEHILAFHDVSPQAPVHVLVIPKHKLVSFSDLAEAPAEVVSELFQGAARVAQALGLSENGYRVVLNTGREGGQTVNYIHLHLLAGRQMLWPPG
jgi:histidine triad (HIT) family protein